MRETPILFPFNCSRPLEIRLGDEANGQQAFDPGDKHRILFPCTKGRVILAALI